MSTTYVPPRGADGKIILGALPTETPDAPTPAEAPTAPPPVPPRVERSAADLLPKAPGQATPVAAKPRDKRIDAILVATVLIIASIVLVRSLTTPQVAPAPTAATVAPAAPTAAVPGQSAPTAAALPAPAGYASINAIDTASWTPDGAPFALPAQPYRYFGERIGVRCRIVLVPDERGDIAQPWVPCVVIGQPDPTPVPAPRPVVVAVPAAPAAPAPCTSENATYRTAQDVTSPAGVPLGRVVGWSCSSQLEADASAGALATQMQAEQPDPTAIPPTPKPRGH